MANLHAVGSLGMGLRPSLMGALPRQKFLEPRREQRVTKCCSSMFNGSGIFTRTVMLAPTNLPRASHRPRCSTKESLLGLFWSLDAVCGFESWVHVVNRCVNSGQSIFCGRAVPWLIREGRSRLYPWILAWRGPPEVWASQDYHIWVSGSCSDFWLEFNYRHSLECFGMNGSLICLVAWYPG